MSLTNPNKPDNYSFLQCAKDFYESTELYKIPQSAHPTQFPSNGFLYEYLASREDFMHSWPDNTKSNEERIETITIFLLLNAAIEGEI